ncbi:MAG: tetratricopeptide repeat protein [candidate division Zixibacteria bacterium]|nr:tetratricopeptide repeat protein [candidate division Zixibacteria bacterium]
MPNNKKKKRKLPAKKRVSTTKNKTNVKKNKTFVRPNDLTSTFQKARLLYAQNQFSDTIELLEKLPLDIATANKTDVLEYYRLLAFSFTNENEFNKAHDITIEALKLDENDRDFYFVQSFIATSFKDYKRALSCGQKFLELFKNDKLKTDVQYLSNGQLHLLYNYLGLAFKSQNDYKKAIEFLNMAHAESPKYMHPYLNLGNLYFQQKDYDKAEAIVEKGLNNCYQVQELQLLKKSFKNKATISACMIVKNEEEMLPNCLESIRSWVDEIIIVDTGSTDKTVEIAKSYGAKVYNQEWTKDFSFHRNYSISKATCDWIFIIDADEEFVLDDLPTLRQAAAQDDYRIVSFNIFNVNKETGQNSSFLHSIRMFRRDAGLRYDGIVHNQLMFDPGEKAVRLGTSIRHYGYDLSPEKMKEKLARSRELLEKQLIDDPNNCFVHYNYSQLLRSSGAHPDASTCHLMLKHSALAVELSKEDDKYGDAVELMALHQMATSHISLLEYEKALEYCEKALVVKPDFLDALLSMAHAYTGLKEFNKAEKYYNEYLDTREKYDETVEEVNLIQIYVGATYLGHYGLGLIYELRGDFERAEKYYLEAIKHLDTFRDVLLRLARIYLDRKDSDLALEFINKHLDWKPDSDLANLYKSEYFAQKENRIETDLYLNKALELTEDSIEVHDRAAKFLYNMREYNRVIPVLEKLIQLLPESVQNIKNLATSYYNTGDYGNAGMYYDRYLKDRADDFEAINDLANCYYKQNNFEKAEVYYSMALERNDKLNLIYRNLGLTRLQLGKAKEALTLLEKYCETAQEDVEIELIIGSTYCQLGQYTEAIKHLEKHLFFNQNNISGLFNISECYYHLGYTDSAAIGYTQILKIDPEFQPAINRLGEIKTEKTPV